MISFSDFKSKRNELKEKRIAYRNKIREASQIFLDTYIQSLELPSKSFQSINGETHPYVYVAIDGQGVHPENAFDKARVDLENGLAFELITAFDDDPQRYKYHRISLTMYLISGDDEPTLSLGNGNVFCNIKDSQKIQEACELIKHKILLEIESEQIGKKKIKENGKHQNLWE
ncbi:hypothetical protein [Phytobacter sp. RSE-02]|uniref:hypothetical protein n=1 Tax=Phytobacter sp. RSE-02 TaxID=3229229 RepID=UPI00339D385A